MISEDCNIESFAESLKDEDSMAVICAAIEEATAADRLFMKKGQLSGAAAQYSRQLKQLINYHRYAVKPYHPKEASYNIYMKYWGQHVFN